MLGAYKMKVPLGCFTVQGLTLLVLKMKMKIIKFQNNPTTIMLGLLGDLVKIIIHPSFYYGKTRLPISTSPFFQHLFLIPHSSGMIGSPFFGHLGACISIPRLLGSWGSGISWDSTKARRDARSWLIL